MVVSCSARLCDSRPMKGCRISFHCFPLDEELRKLWTIAMNRPDFKPSKSSKLCSAHFQPDDFVQHFGMRKLRPNVIPSKFKTHLVEDVMDKELLAARELTINKPQPEAPPTPPPPPLPPQQEQEQPQQKTIPITEPKVMIPRLTPSVKKDNKPVVLILTNDQQNVKAPSLANPPVVIPTVQLSPSPQVQPVQNETENVSIIKKYIVITSNREKLEASPAQLLSTVPSLICPSLPNVNNGDNPIAILNDDQQKGTVFGSQIESFVPGPCPTITPNKRRRSVPVHMGDFREHDLNDPQKVRLLWNIARKTIERQKKRIGYLERKYYRLKKKIMSITAEDIKIDFDL